jgi:hypothetical protein
MISVPEIFCLFPLLLLVYSAIITGCISYSIIDNGLNQDDRTIALAFIIISVVLASFATWGISVMAF